MLIDGVIKRYPMAVMELKTPYYTGTVKALCVENPVQDIIIGNVSGALRAETQINRKQSVTTGLDAKASQTHGDVTMNITEQTVTNTTDNTTTHNIQTHKIGVQTDDNNESPDQGAAVQTRAMVRLSS